MTFGKDRKLSSLDSAEEVENKAQRDKKETQVKKILIGLMTLVLVIGLAGAGAFAYFSDVETSTGNTFTAGSIDLKIDNTCYLNGKPVEGCTWGLTDLTDQLFFKFKDLKPGDWGEDTVSMHVYNNDAWACVTFANLVNNDNTCTEPEDADDEPMVVGCGNDPNAGELAQNLYFVFWADDGNNIWETNEPILMQGLASDVLGGKTYPIADSTFSIAGQGKPLKGSTTYYIGKAWCFGTITMTGGHPTCNGEEVTNASQSDSLTGDIIFYAEQARNNPGFVCGQR